ncbi:MAG: DUF1800 domain-containing protein [Burkholderiaceae bacterium]|nr:DUF1800 domain-containing protein [Burkholderiaceae bacterium]
MTTLLYAPVALPPAVKAPPPKTPTKVDSLGSRVNRGVGAATVLVGLAACGGGEDASTSAAPKTASLLTPGPSAHPSVADAGRFLTQATLGFNRADLNALRKSTYAAWLENQFLTPRSQSHYDWLIENGYGDNKYINTQSGLDNTIWRKLISSNDPLRQRMVLALSEIFVVSILGINAQWRQFSAANYLDILESNAFGNYRTLLQQITLSPAMGYYLTYRGNAKSNPANGSQPDENYARELMQLFSIGLVKLQNNGNPTLGLDGNPIETYQQSDVSGLARVFTGWDIDTSGLTSPRPPDYQKRPMISVATKYETGSKKFLDTTIAAGTSAIESLNTALDSIFYHPNVPPFISKQLIQRLVTSNPTPGYVARVAAVFSNNGAGVRGDLKAVLQAILLDAEARDASLATAPTYGKVREPMVRFLNWAKAYNATSPSGAWNIGDLSNPATRLGQSPMRSGSVFNFFRPGYVPPGTALAAKNMTGPELQIINESSVAGYINYMTTIVTGRGAGDLTPDYKSLLSIAKNPPGLLAEINQVLAGSQVSEKTLSTIEKLINSMASTTETQLLNRIYAALTLVLASPEFIVQK